MKSQGLKDSKKACTQEVRGRVACLEIKDFTKLVNVAAVTEMGHKDYEASKEKRKRFIPYATRPTKKLAVGSGSRQKVRKEGTSKTRSTEAEVSKMWEDACWRI
jgi:hypothetical protein